MRLTISPQVRYTYCNIHTILGWWYRCLDLLDCIVNTNNRSRLINISSLTIKHLFHGRASYYLIFTHVIVLLLSIVHIVQLAYLYDLTLA